MKGARSFSQICNFHRAVFEDVLRLAPDWEMGFSDFGNGGDGGSCGEALVCPVTEFCEPDLDFLELFSELESPPSEAVVGAFDIRPESDVVVIPRHRNDMERWTNVENSFSSRIIALTAFVSPA